MGVRRTVTIPNALPSAKWERAEWCRDWDAIRMEFGPWWYRWWLIVWHGGRPHAVITGEPCVVFRAARAAGGEG